MGTSSECIFPVDLRNLAYLRRLVLLWLYVADKVKEALGYQPGMRAATLTS